MIGVLGVFGFNPNSPTPQNPILEGIWGLYRRLEAVIYRDPPTAAGGALPQVEVTRTADGLVEVTGNVGFEDPTGNPLAYTSTDGEYGTVTVHEDGTFTYTVTDPAGFTGTDTFTVTA
ncbi:Ig-like domain-containing protein, partial [Mycolicibacterium sphagni]|uniref:Ig-like domain-containing protein n=1 Tax=Mycolicibacterium sphagni TaxID=1786 RepID=UPI0021F37A81